MHPVVRRTFARRLVWAFDRLADPALAVALGVLLAWFAAQGF